RRDVAPCEPGQAARRADPEGPRIVEEERGDGAVEGRRALEAAVAQAGQPALGPHPERAVATGPDRQDGVVGQAVARGVRALLVILPAGEAEAAAHPERAGAVLGDGVDPALTQAGRARLAVAGAVGGLGHPP